jgi:hypothetical protein
MAAPDDACRHLATVTGLFSRVVIEVLSSKQLENVLW